MCGIAGYFGTRELAPARLDACLAGMRRRGPDHTAYRCWTTPSGRRAYLLSSRLRIIDLDPRANQPFQVGRKWMSYNGEAYNYLELRDELAGAGRQFTTSSDTEVVLTAFDERGGEAWDGLEGMWALAVYDEDDGSMTLSRDRFGEKPLYVFEDSSGIYFGSEPKCIAALLGAPLAVNTPQMLRFLVNGYRSLYKGTDTFFEGLYEVPSGTTLRIGADGAVTRRRYWTATCGHEEAMTYDDAVAGIRSRLTRAVEIRLRADVPLAFCQSGGVDSNALAAIASRLCGYDVHGFTVVDDDPRYDERTMAGSAAKALGIRHTEVHTDTAGFLDRLRALVAYHDAPVYTISYYAHALLMERIAGHGYRVAVSGTAADEILTGYYDHHLAYLYAVRHDAPRFDAARDAWRQRIQPFVRNPHLGDPDLFVREPGFRDHLYFEADRYASYLTHPWHEAFAEEAYCGDLLRNRMLNELRHEVVPVILHEDDLNAMYWSIENRSPFLDRQLVEFSSRIPTRHLVQGGFAKAVLRDAVAGIVPDEVLANPQKVGFNAPIRSFLDVRAPAVRQWLLDDSPIFEHVRRDSITTLIDRPELPNSDSKFLFSFVSSKMFLEAFAA